jgi:hypothetical protein
MPRTTTVLGKVGLVLFGLILTLLGLELCLRATGWLFL